MHPRRYHHSIVGILSIAVGSSADLRADGLLVDQGNWRLESMSVVADGGPARNVNATFVGLPWVEYTLFSSEDASSWSPIGPAPEGSAGHYLFHHASVDERQFYRAQLAMPGPVKTLDAHFQGGMSGLFAATQRHALAYNQETLHAVHGALLDLRRGIEQATQALMGVVNVVDLQNGSFQVSWAGNQQIANGPAARDAAAQGYQQQRFGTQQQLNQAQQAIGEMDTLLTTTLTVEPLGLEEATLADDAWNSIRAYLPLPTGPAYFCYDAAFAWFDLDAMGLNKRALEKEKAALEQRIARLRAEATRKRQVAAMPVQVFGVNGTWFVRWSNVELTFPNQAAALATGIPQIDALKAARLAEADALDAEADALQAQLPALTAKLDAACASLATLDTTYQNKLATCPGGITDPEDTDHPQVRWSQWIQFPPEFVDPMWEDLYREWQARRDALRNALIAMGASPETIAEALRDMDNEFNPRRKWMTIYCEEPIKLTLMFINQFTGFTVDSANAIWCVEYENRFTGKIESVQVGTGPELCLTPEQAKAIYSHAESVQNTPGVSELLDISVKFDRVYPDGKRVRSKVTQQVIITDWTRAAHNAVFGNVPR